MGDVLHAMPAVTEAHRYCPALQVDWVVETAFASLVHRHRHIHSVISVNLRRWRKQGWSARHEIGEFYRRLRQNSYDWVLDSQGLVKSATLALLARGKRAGFDRQSVREWPASLVYSQKIGVPKSLHALQRQRLLWAQLLGYSLADTAQLDYGLLNSTANKSLKNNDLWLLHGTTWASKLWPLAHWQKLAVLAVEAGWQVHIPSGNESERDFAQKIANGLTNVTLYPSLGLDELLTKLTCARAVVGVDSGLLHLAAALDRPAIGLYGPTDADLTGSMSIYHRHLSVNFPCAPCFLRHCPLEHQPPCWKTVTPEQVWLSLNKLIHLPT